jgi:hypothetical protein
MTFRTVVVVALVWAASLVGVAVWAQGSAVQAPAGPTVIVQGPAPMIQASPGQPYGRIISGEDIGFQLVRGQSVGPGQVAGRLMVRIDGQWFEASGAARPVPVRAK